MCIRDRSAISQLLDGGTGGSVDGSIDDLSNGLAGSAGVPVSYTHLLSPAVYKVNILML